MVADVPMPPAVAARPRDARGYPVPAITPWVKGTPRFGVISVERTFLCALERRCSICALVMPPVWRVVGRSEAEAIAAAAARGQAFRNAAPTAEAPGHRTCMLYAAMVCPWLSRPTARRGTPGPAAGIEVVRARDAGPAAPWSASGRTTSPSRRATGCCSASPASSSLCPMTSAPSICPSCRRRWRPAQRRTTTRRPTWAPMKRRRRGPSPRCATSTSGPELAPELVVVDGADPAATRIGRSFAGLRPMLVVNGALTEEQVTWLRHSSGVIEHVYAIGSVPEDVQRQVAELIAGPLGYTTTHNPIAPTLPH